MTTRSNKTLQATPVCALLLIMTKVPGAPEFTSEVTWQEFSLGFFHSSFGGWFSRVLDRIFAQVDLIK